MSLLASPTGRELELDQLALPKKRSPRPGAPQLRVMDEHIAAIWDGEKAVSASRVEEPHRAL